MPVEDTLHGHAREEDHRAASAQSRGAVPAGRARRSGACALLAVALVASACAGGERTAVPTVAAETSSPASQRASIGDLGPGVHDLEVGGEAAMLLLPERSNGRLVIYAHGYRTRANALLSDEAFGGLAAGLVDAGYTVAAGDAAGDAWGNDASVDAYADLADTVAGGVGATDVFLVAESMGGLAAARLVSDRRIDGLRAYAGIYPLCDLGSVYGDFRESVDTAYGSAVPQALADLSPVLLDGGVPVLFWASPDDTTVDKERNADVCAAQVTADGGSAVVVETEGKHLDPSNFDLAALLDFFESSVG
jgi:hypothetical protein